MKKALIKSFFCLLLSILFMACNNNKKNVQEMLLKAQENQLKTMIHSFEENVRNGSYFVWDEKTENYLLNDNFGDDYRKLWKFHVENHPVCSKDSKEWEKWMYFHNHEYKDGTEDLITFCPFCLYFDNCIKENPDFIGDKDTTVKAQDLAFWNTIVIPTYKSMKDKKIAELNKTRLPEDWRDYTLLGFRRGILSSMAARSIPGYAIEKLNSKKAGDVFNIKNLRTRSNLSYLNTIGILDDLSINRTQNTATFIYKSYVTSKESKEQLELLTCKITLRFQPNNKTAFVYRLDTTTKGDKLVVEYDDDIYDYQFMAEQAYGILITVMDFDKI